MMTEERRYNSWAGNPKGDPENKERCVQHVYPQDYARGMISVQCSRKRGHGPDGLYCKQHAKNYK